MNGNLVISVAFGQHSGHFSVGLKSFGPGISLVGVWQAMLLRHLVVSLAICSGHGWWKADESKEDPWRTWVSDKFPTAVEYYDYAQERTASSRQVVAGWGEAISERGLWVVFDGIAGLFGWALFGSAWNDVKSGFRKAIQLAILVVLCVVIHYVPGGPFGPKNRGQTMNDHENVFLRTFVFFEAKWFSRCEITLFHGQMAISTAKWWFSRFSRFDRPSVENHTVWYSQFSFVWSRFWRPS